MTRNSTRTYWMTNEDWYKIEDDKFVLTPLAPPEARRSFAEWHTKPKMTWYRFRLSLLPYFYEAKYAILSLFEKKEKKKSKK